MISTTYDPEGDVLYVRIAPQGTVTAGTQEIEPDVLLDFDGAGHVIGIEILNVRFRAAGKYQPIP